MRLIKIIFKRMVQFLRHLSREYVYPCFYAAEAREAQRKKAQTCCEVREVISINYNDNTQFKEVGI